MGLMAWLFPKLEAQRRESTARIDAALRRIDEEHEAERPIFELAQDVIPLLDAVESEGRRPTTLYVPADRKRAVEIAHAEVSFLRGVVAPPDCKWTILGLEVKTGPELRVE